MCIKVEAYRLLWNSGSHAHTSSIAFFHGWAPTCCLASGQADWWVGGRGGNEWVGGRGRRKEWVGTETQNRHQQTTQGNLGKCHTLGHHDLGHHHLKSIYSTSPWFGMIGISIKLGFNQSILHTCCSFKLVNISNRCILVRFGTFESLLTISNTQKYIVLNM